ncbi:TonB-dependent receptor [Reichenbachiella sp.]|uniref:SusC/RagA family TonB-linked outer membrane protein n=1 Tax=Reichenbachiella sp. TaxID=2184521 RepID=UPI0032986287
MKKIILLVLIISIGELSYSQVIVKGKVTDESGGGIPGATITEVATTNGVVTDIDGNYSFEVASDDALISVSFLGFIKQELTLNGRSVLDVVLKEDIEQLEEVVVIGYGTVRKSDVTGSVSSIKVEDNVSRQSNTIDQLIQGRAAGVQVIQNGGAPGSGVSVRIRGTSSLRGNNEPLYVVDGIIIASAGEDVAASGGVGNAGQETQNGLNGINPRDIESIEVLKDASATAVYGSRGANGVILITTKKGKSGATKINAFATYGVSAVDRKIEVLDGVEYARYRNESALMQGSNALYHISDGNVYPISYPEGSGTPTISSVPADVFNWQDEMYQYGRTTNAGVSLSGGHDDGNYYVSFGYNDQAGILANAHFQSGDIRVNLDQKLNDKLELKTRLSGFYSASDFSEGGDLIGGSQSVIRNILAFSPIIPNNLDETFDFEDGQTIIGPRSYTDDFEDVSKESRFVGSVNLIYDLPVEGLKFSTEAGGNIRSKDRRRFYGLTTWQGANGNGALQISQLTSTSYQINNFLRYNKTFDKRHRINVTIGTTYDVRSVELSTYAVEDFVTTELTTQQPLLGQVITSPLSITNNEQQIFSLVGRVNYTFNDKYVLTASVRRDGVSKFSEENRYGIFPSFALAWRASEESFVQNLGIFDDLKVRAGWGQIGNHGIGPYGTLSNYGSSPTNLYGNADNGTNVPVALTNVANPDLTWETTEQVNVGLDFGILNNRVTGSLDVYDKTTKDLLQNTPIPTSSGFTNLLINRGIISNRGIELGLNGVILDNNDFSFELGGNIAFNKTKIEELGIPVDSILLNGEYGAESYYFGSAISRGNIFKSPANIFIEGQETSLFYGFETDGIYQSTDEDILDGAQPGDRRFVDQNGDGVIDTNDRTVIGNPNPDFVFGINMSFNYKRFSARFLFSGVYGNDIANGNLLTMYNAVGIWSNVLPAAYHNAWRPDAESNEFPRIGYTENAAQAIPDYIIEDGSYLRLNNVTIGYDLPLDKFVSSANIYVSGQNLFTLTGYSGYNPEVTSFLYDGLINGVDWNGGPNARTILVGLNITF